MLDVYRDQLRQLLQGSSPEALARRQSAFRAVEHRLNGGVLIWGCGALGRMIAEALPKLDISLTAFVDRNQDLWGTTVRGATVVSPGDVLSGKFKERVVIVGVYTSAPVRALLSACEQPMVTFPELAWGFPEVMLPFFDLADPGVAASDAEAVNSGLSVWADDASRDEYVRQLQWRFTLDYDILPPHLPASDTYFPPIYLRLSDNEHYVDCGAFDGDSIREFLSRTEGNFARITALEADKLSFARLGEFVETLPAWQREKIDLQSSVIGPYLGEALFCSDGTVRSSLSGEGEVVKMTTLDEISSQHPITFVKMDIEGSEPAAIAGARRAIVDDRPVLAICLYHAFDHLWTIPNALYALVQEYDFFLGRHSDECWELVCYAVPRERHQNFPQSSSRIASA